MATSKILEAGAQHRAQRRVCAATGDAGRWEEELAWSLALEALEAPGPSQLCGTTPYGILWLTGCFAAG